MAISASFYWPIEPSLLFRFIETLIEKARPTMKNNILKFALVVSSLVCLQALTLGAADPVFSAPTTAAQKNFDQLVKNRSCRGCDLAGLDFNRMDLSGVDLEGADLSSAKFYLTNLAGANLKNTRLNGAIFGGADLGKADLRGADLDGTSLDSAYLGETLLDRDSTEAISDEIPPPPAVGQTIKDNSIAAANIDSSGKQTVVAEVNGVAKDIANGEQVEMTQEPRERELAIDENNIEKTGVGDKRSTVENPKESESVEVDTRPALSSDVIDSSPLERGQGSSSTLVGGDDSKEDLTMVNIKQANLARLLDKKRCFGCDLSELNLSDKNLKGADLENANLSGCNLESVKLDRANLKGALLQRANLRNASLKEADLYKADLTDADLTNADVKGALFDGAKISEAIGLLNDSPVLMNQ
jgi:uncharacterized protein YjbI with pentapeptide repeats